MVKRIKNNFKFLIVLLLLFVVSCKERGEKRTSSEQKIFNKNIFTNWSRVKAKPFYLSKEVLVYHSLMGNVDVIKSKNKIEEQVASQIASLPEDLIILPGVYQFQNKIFSLTEEGLYRFVDVKDISKQQQRIVYRNNLDALLSSISWVASHGNSDNRCSTAELTELAKRRKLFINCGTISRWGKSVLDKQGVTSRIVVSTTLEEKNKFDNGHVLLEVYKKPIEKWVVYDIDMNSTFTIQKTPLSFIEFAYAVNNNVPYKIINLASDTQMDISNFKDNKGKDYALIMERIIAQSHQWYKRVLQVPFINNTFFDEANKDYIKKIYPTRKFMLPAEFERVYYGNSSAN